MREIAQMRMREDLCLEVWQVILIGGGVGYFAGILEDLYGFAYHFKGIRSLYRHVVRSFRILNLEPIFQF